MSDFLEDDDSADSSDDVITQAEFADDQAKFHLKDSGEGWACALLNSPTPEDTAYGTQTNDAGCGLPGPTRNLRAWEQRRDWWTATMQY